MKRQIIWLVVSWLMVLSLVLVSCAPKPAEEVAPKEAAPTAPKEVAPTVPKEVVAPVAEKPKYGGVITLGLTRTGWGIIGQYWDQVYGGVAWWGLPHNLTLEELLIGDWKLGPAGSGRTTFMTMEFTPDGFFRNTGRLAESWQIPDRQTLIFKIRKGVRWQNLPPVNGRELTPEDVLFNIRRMYFHPTFTTYNVASAAAKVTDAYLDPNDPWTVVVKMEDKSIINFEDIGDKLYMYAPEVVAKYGDAKNWRNWVGTGPYILKDYISASSVTMVKNPDYWMKDPLNPENTLPYADQVIGLQILDTSTLMSAMRTGKIDWVTGVKWEDADSLKKTSPHINIKSWPGGSTGIQVRRSSADPRAIPMQNQRVMQAMAMAIDQEAIFRDYFKSQGNFLNIAFAPDSPYYIPLENMAEELYRVWGAKLGITLEDAKIVEKMYGYYPDEAKRILAQEGYPNGFKTTILIDPTNADFLSIVAGYLKKNLNIDLEIDVRETAVVSSMTFARQHQALRTGGGIGVGWPERWFFHGPTDQNPAVPRYADNRDDIRDDILGDIIARSQEAWMAGNFELRSRIIKEAVPYVLWRAWAIFLPSATSLNVYQPWLKNNGGANGLGYRNNYNAFMFAWVDQDLKAKILGKK